MIEEEYVLCVLESFCHNHKQQEQEFECLKQKMSYDSKLKKNVIAAYDLILLLMVGFINQQSVSQDHKSYVDEEDTPIEVPPQPIMQ